MESPAWGVSLARLLSCVLVFVEHSQYGFTGLTELLVLSHQETKVKASRGEIL